MTMTIKWLKENMKSKMISIDINNIYFDRNNNAGRKTATYQLLKDSIKSDGLLSPIDVIKIKERYKIVAGRQRFKACKELGFTHIDARLLGE